MIYDDSWVSIYQGNCLDELAQLPAESIQMVCTSPPYWGLRKYSGEQEMVWGGAPDCEHKWESDIKRGGAGQGGYTGSVRWQHIAQEAQDKNIPVRDIKPEAWAKERPQFAFCSLCGAVKCAFGLESTPED